MNWLDDLKQLTVPHLEQYFGVWAIQEEPFRAAVDRVCGMNLHTHVIEQRSSGRNYDDAYAYEMVGETALISITGPLMKQASSLSGGSSTVALRRQVRRAAADDAVSSIALRIDSPGGTMAGTQELADDIAAAAAKKPVHAYIEDLGASAAYWLASQATKVFANRTAMVGSIGTFAVLYDMSAMAAKEGVKVHVIKAGDFKGTGVAGTEVTQDQLAEWQRLITESNDHFLQAVATGRKLSLAGVRAVADGRVHLAASAKELGLIDAVQSLDETLQQLQTKRSTKTMSQANAAIASAATEGAVLISAPQPATYAELKAACAGADADFICKQLDAKATVQHATQCWMAEQNARIEAANKKAAEAEDKVKAAAEKPGVKALGTAGNTATTSSCAVDGDPKSEWDEKVAAEVKRGKPQHEATKMVARKFPDLRAAYVAAHNAEFAATRTAKR